MGFPHSAKGSISQKTVQMLEALIPASMSMSQFPEWREAFCSDSALIEEPNAGRTLAIIIVGRAASEATIASLREQLGPFNLKVAILDALESPLVFERSRYAAVCEKLSAHSPDGWLVIRAGTLLRPFACAAILGILGDQGEGEGAASSDLCFADYESFDSDGAVIPLFWPIFDYERLLSQGYGEGFFAFRQPPEIGDPDGGEASTYDILLAAVARLTGDVTRVAHVPKLLASVPRVPAGSAASSLADAVARHLSLLGTPATITVKDSAILPCVAIQRSGPRCRSASSFRRGTGSTS